MRTSKFGCEPMLGAASPTLCLLRRRQQSRLDQADLSRRWTAFYNANQTVASSMVRASVVRISIF